MHGRGAAMNDHRTLRARPGGGSRRDHGVTLIEMLLAISLVGVIMGSVTMATVVLFRNTGVTTERVATAQDTRQLVNYFPGDVRSSDEFTIHDGGRTVGSGCAGVSSSSPLHLELTSSDRLARTEYRTATAGDRAVLNRWTCTRPTPTGGFGPAQRVRVGDDLDPARPVSVREVIVDGSAENSRIELEMHRLSGTAIVLAATPFRADPPATAPTTLPPPTPEVPR